MSKFLQFFMYYLIIIVVGVVIELNLPFGHWVNMAIVAVCGFAAGGGIAWLLRAEE